MPQAAGGAVKTGLDYVGVGLGYAKSVRFPPLHAHKVSAVEGLSQLFFWNLLLISIVIGLFAGV